MDVRQREALTAWALSLPAMLGVALLLFLPSLTTAVLSLSDWQLGSENFNWVGLSNYESLIQDSSFRMAFKNTIFYMVTVVPVSIVLGLFFAVLIESEKAGRSFYRAALFLPVTSTLVAMAVVWQFMLHPSAGIINVIVQHLGAESVNWLGDPDTVMAALCGIGVWEMTGLAMVLFMAGLQSISKEIYDAGEIDGINNSIERFTRITFPMLGTTTFFVITYCAIRAFQVFDTVQVLTHGGPGKSSEVMLHLIYTEGFQFFRTGYASAIVVVYITMILIFTFTKTYFTKRLVRS